MILGKLIEKVILVEHRRLIKNKTGTHNKEENFMVRCESLFSQLIALFNRQQFYNWLVNTEQNIIPKDLIPRTIL